MLLLLRSLFDQDVFPSTSPQEKSKGKHISKVQGNIYSPEHLLWMQHPVQALPVLSGTILLFPLPSLLLPPESPSCPKKVDSGLRAGWTREKTL